MKERDIWLSPQGIVFTYHPKGFAADEAGWEPGVDQEGRQDLQEYPEISDGTPDNRSQRTALRATAGARRYTQARLIKR
jgi:hypothetical protein